MSCKLAEIDNTIRGITSDLTHNHIKIYGREHQLIAGLLTLMSPLEINFEGKIIRGWMDTLFFGESQSGKSETIKALLLLAKRGGYISGEGLSNVGLQGGIDKMGDTNVTKPGLFSIHNGEIVFIDELQGMSVDDFSKLSDVRMSGIAKITKVKSFTAPAKCRKIWTANPRPMFGVNHTVKFNSETFPINLVRKLVVQYEDLTRFDLIVGYKQSDFSLKTKNKDLVKPKRIYGEGILSSLVNITWARKTEDIIIPKETEDACYSESERLLNKYQSDFPMVLGAGQPDRMIRLACACASLAIISPVLSVESFEKLVVYPEHVLWVGQWLDRLFNEDDLQYAQYAKKYNDRANAAHKNKAILVSKIRAIENHEQLLYALSNATCISIKQLREEAPEIDSLDKIVAGLFRSGLLRSTTHGYYKTDLFNDILQNEFVDETSIPNIESINFDASKF